MARVLAGVVAVLVVLYVVAIYPNDVRINGPYVVARDAPRGSDATRVESMLEAGVPHALDMSDEEYAKALEAATPALGTLAQTASPRFRSRYQVYVPVGRYPARLDARDGVFIPAGRTLTVEPTLAGRVEVRFGVYGLGAKARVEARVESAAPFLTVASSPHAQSVLPWSLERYLRVDQAALAPRWDDGVASVSLAKDAHVRLTCAAEGPGCLVSDVRFHVPTNQLKNVVVILVDTLRGDGPEGGNAKAMAAFGREATVFKQALAPGNMTSPSTNAFLACSRPSTLGSIAFSYAVDPEQRAAFYKSSRLSFPARFAKMGYETAMIGNVSVISEAFGVGVHHGFARQISLETDAYDTPQIAREAVRWLGENGRHPFLLYVHFNGPHAPYRAPLADVFKSIHSATVFRSYPDVLLSLYQGEVRYTDRYLDKILNALKDLDLADATTVVLTADHGDQHELRSYAGNVAAPDFGGAYFDHGATLLNDEIRVPLMIRRPGGTPHVVEDTYVSTLDVGPTLLEVANVASIPGVDPCEGHSLAPYLERGDAGAPSDPPTIGSEGFKGRAIVFQNRYKYIRTYDPTDKRVYDRGGWSGPRRLYMAPEQLYDLAVDPGERINLVLTAPDLLRDARQRYTAFYGIKDAFELVVDNPDGQPVTVEFPGLARAKVRVVDGIGELEEPAGASLRFVGRESKRFLFRLLEGDDRELQTPRVRLGDASVALTYSSLHLPLGRGVAGTPAEPSGPASLPDVARAPTAFLRRVEDDGQEGRYIASGNPQFEKVLREWGYLNDGK